MTITFALSHQIISRTDSMILASGSKNYVTAQFDLLTEDWTAPITAIFNEYTVVLDEDNQCLVPWEVLANPGKVAVSAFCGDLHTATSVLVPVHPSGYTDGQTPQPPTPGVYEQLLDKVKTAVDTANKVQEQVDVILGKKAPSTFAEIRFAVEQGRATQYFSVGDQLKPTWMDDGTNYEDPFDIVQMEVNPELETGETIHGMMIQQHYANIHACPFDAREALYDADEELPAGTYHFTVAGNTWLSSENGKIVQFTLTQPIPQGGQLVFGGTDRYNKPIVGQSLNVYSGPSSFDAIETVVLSEGSEGTDLGSTDGLGKLNHYQRAQMGSGRWKTSMLRQYLNSDKPAGQWWTKQDRWDRASAFIHTVPGYMSGFDADFLSVIKPVKVQTSRDTVLSDGGTDITYDYFFPISLEQMNAAPQAAGVEGSAFDYWKAIAAEDTTGNLDTSGRFKQFGIYPDLVALLLSAKTSKVSCFLRSVRRTMTYNPWVIYADGGVTSYSAVSEFSCVPACVIG